MLVVLVVGLGLSTLINWFVVRQWGNVDHASRSLVPFVSALLQRDWIALGVDSITLAMTMALWQNYGWSAEFVGLLLAAAVLIYTAALDWKVRLIDTLVMLGATLAALVFAPLLAGTWPNALLGAVVAAMVFVLLFMLARIMYPGQHAPFGLGDVYLGMFIGALVGITDVGAALLYGMLLAGLASVVLLVVHGYRQARHMPIAYGAFLCVGVLLHLVLQPL